MRKNVLALSIAALVGSLGLAGGASAGVFGQGTRTADSLEVNTDGIGHILLVPYYSAANGTMTIVNLVNSDTVNGKAVKLRFRGAANSDDVFDFQLYMSPGDVYSGAIAQSDNNAGASLQSADNTCTLPYSVKGLGGTAAPTKSDFVTSRLGGAGVKGTLEGYVEILNMADIPPASALYTAIKHVNGVAPCSTTVMNNLAFDPLDATTPTGTATTVSNYFTNPTTGLFANWTIINVNNVASWGGNANAIEARVLNTGASAAGNIVFSPQTAQPATALDLTYTADPLIAGSLLPSGAGAAKYDFPDLSTPYVTAAPTATPATNAAAVTQANVLTGSLAVSSVKNEFITSSSVVGSTDWVFSMPTRRYSVALNYTTGLRVYTTLPGNYFTSSNTTIDSTTARVAQAGVSVICSFLPGSALSYYNRSEGTPGAADPTFVISPGVPAVAGTLTLCGEASVLAFNSTRVDISDVLNASIGMNQINLTGYSEGWASINTVTAAHPNGLPILGSAFQRFRNVGASGVLGNFGSAWPHRNTRVAQTAVAPQ